MARSRTNRFVAASRNKLFLQFAKMLSTTPALYLLARSADPAYRLQFTEVLRWQMAKFESLGLEKAPLTQFLRFCKKNEGQLPHQLRKALRKRTSRVAQRRRDHSHLVTKLGLGNFDEEVKVAGLKARTQEYVVEPLAVPYPPKGFYVCESEEGMHGWDDFVNRRRLPDKRRVCDFAHYQATSPLILGL